MIRKDIPKKVDIVTFILSDHSLGDQSCFVYRMSRIEAGFINRPTCKSLEFHLRKHRKISIFMLNFVMKVSMLAVKMVVDYQNRLNSILISES